MEPDFRSVLEKSIDNLLEKNKNISSDQRNLIDEGKTAILSVKYGFNFDECKSIYCFRSAKKTEVLDLSNYTFYRSADKFCNSNDLHEFQAEMMKKICESVNNTGDDLKSYSKGLAAPLFKYNNRESCLLISEISTNTFQITFEISCFNWFETYDENGEEENRYHSEYYEVVIPFKELASKKQLFSNIYDFLSGEVGWISEFMDVDNISFEIEEVSIDISESNRNCFDRYYNEQYTTWFKRYASYKKDKEVLTSSSNFRYSIQNNKIIQLIKYIYILKIGNCYTIKVDNLINEIINGEYRGYVEVNNDDKMGLRWIVDYLNKNVDFERENYFSLFDYQSDKFFSYYKQRGCIDYLKDICNSKFDTHFERHYLIWLLKMSEIN